MHGIFETEAEWKSRQTDFWEWVETVGDAQVWAQIGKRQLFQHKQKGNLMWSVAGSKLLRDRLDWFLPSQYLSFPRDHSLTLAEREEEVNQIE